MLRAKQVGQVLRALVDFASKHAVFEAGNRTTEPNPVRFGWMCLAGQKTMCVFHIFFLFNDDLICVFFVDPKKNLGEFVHFSEFAGDKQAGKAAGLKRVKLTLVVLQNSDFLKVQPLLGESSHLAKYLENHPHLYAIFLAIWKVEKNNSPGIGGLTCFIMVPWLSGQTLATQQLNGLQVPVVLAGDLNCSSFGRLRGVANTLSLLHLDSLIEKTCRDY